MTKFEISRRHFVQASAAGTLALSGFSRATGSAQRRPNIVFILADDMGYADISANSRSSVATPNIDRIAQSGINLRQAYANSAVCSASRLALITGRYQYRLPLGLEEPLTSADVGLDPEIPTLPSLLRDAGYNTALVGKWHLGGLPDYGPLKSGYDHFFGFRSGAVDYFTHKTLGGQPDLWDGTVPTSQVGYMTNILGERATDMIDEFAQSARPFFLSVHFSAPHWPWETEEDREEARRLEEAGAMPQGDPANPTLRHWDGGSRKIYESMIATMDRQVGRIIDTLQARGLWDDTIVVFTSDNGGERFADVWPFSGQKSELLEGGIRVPALMSWPAFLPHGVVNQQVNLTMDWMPTLLSAAGAEPAPDYPSDGIDLLPMLRNDIAPQNRQVFWRYKANNQRAMRDGNYKYLKIAGNTFLFNVVEDPLERANLKFREPATFERLQETWKQWNAGMLPEQDDTFTEGVLAQTQADHIGANETIKTADPGD